MYLTAQHIRSQAGNEEFHAYLHFHGIKHGPFADPLSVPVAAPGKLVKASHRSVPAGGNTVLSYVDIVADDAVGRAVSLRSTAHSPPWWKNGLESLGKSMGSEPVPWVAEFGEVHVIFNAVPEFASPLEYDRLVAAVLELWSQWRAEADASV